MSKIDMAEFERNVEIVKQAARQRRQDAMEKRQTETWHTIIGSEELESMLRSHFGVPKSFGVCVTSLTRGDVRNDVTGLSVTFQRHLPLQEQQRSGIVADDERTA